MFFNVLDSKVSTVQLHHKLPSTSTTNICRMTSIVLTYVECFLFVPIGSQLLSFQLLRRFQLLMNLMKGRARIALVLKREMILETPPQTRRWGWGKSLKSSRCESERDGESHCKLAGGFDRLNSEGEREKETPAGSERLGLVG